MPFILQECVVEDVDRLLEISYAAFQEDVWGRIMFPNPAPPDGDTPTKRRYRKLITSEPKVIIMKAVDIDTNEMVAVARWEMNYDLKSEAEWNNKAKREWDEGTNVAAADALIAAVVEKDREFMGDKPHVCE